MSVPLEVFISSLTGLAAACCGVIYGLVARSNAMRVKGSLDVTQKQVEVLEKTACESRDYHEICKEAHAGTRESLAAIKGDMGIMLALQKVMDEKLDGVHKKVFNGGFAK